jgi:hypothetical protein
VLEMLVLFLVLMRTRKSVFEIVCLLHNNESLTAG